MNLMSLTLPTPSGSTPVSLFTGSWLDINQPSQVWYPDPPTYTDSYVGVGSPQPVQHFITRHQCLLVEVHYPDGAAGDSLKPGETPGSSDCYSQRNIAILGVDNPGGDGSHTVAHPFVIRSTQPAERFGPPEELLLWWNNLPRTCRVQLQMAGVAADEILTLARGRLRSVGLSKASNDTISCAVGGVTYVPIPPRSGAIAAMLIIDLPDDIEYDQRFRVIVQQSGSPRRIVGTFGIDVPVVKARALRRDAENTFAVIAYHAERTPGRHPRRRVLDRYLEILGKRVDGLGGVSSRIPPSPYGAPPDVSGPGCLVRWLYVVRDLLRRLLPEA
jgi:hypothetical protein